MISPGAHCAQDAGALDQASRHRLSRGRLRDGAGIARTRAHTPSPLPFAVMRAHARAGVRAPEVYVLISRVTDPQNLMLTGLPPKDLWEDISQLWLRAGINIDDAWKRACSVTNEWVYEPGPGPLKSRIRQRIMHERSIPLKNRSG